MNPPSQGRRRPSFNRLNRSKRPHSSRASRRPVAGLWLLCALLYAAAGMVSTALAGPWVWFGAALGAIIQCITLAGPEALQRFRWLTANLLVLGSILGGTALAAALSVAFNHLGTDNIDDLALGKAVMEVVLYSLLAVMLAVLCSLATAALGDRLLRRNRGTKTSLFLVITALVGLAVGGGVGLLIA
ncbi:MAG: hypothetical protein WBG38_10635 [Nodosilinea sp.]